MFCCFQIKGIWVEGVDIFTKQEISYLLSMTKHYLFIKNAIRYNVRQNKIKQAQLISNVYYVRNKLKCTYKEPYPNNNITLPKLKFNNFICRFHKIFQ